MKADHSPCSQTDPLSLARFLRQKVSETKTSTENTRVATTGSNRGAAEPAAEPAGESAAESAKKRPRKEVRSDGAAELDHAFASEQETFRALRDVLERRQIYLQSKGIKNLDHKMDEDQRAEFCKEVREEYENLEDQQNKAGA